MSRRHVEVRSGRYHDSVTLLAASRTLAAVPGVAAAQVAMGTPLNVDVLGSMGFELPQVSPDDLVVALRLDDGLDDAATRAARDDALRVLEEALGRREAPGSAEAEPARTTGRALARQPAPLAVVSVPGASAGAEAWDALQAGASVMLFSDNVDLATEVLLKEEATRRGLVVMGPDCGTAVVGGVGLGFANVVRPGPVSLVAASGTGAQQLLALLDAADVGVRHCVGVGGRDLSTEVGGLGAEQALRLLAGDEGTELVVLVSKPADAAVVTRLEQVAGSLAMAIEWAVLGRGAPDLTAAATRVCARLGVAAPQWPRWAPPGQPAPRAMPSGGGLLRGLFAGGTLCDEAMVLAAATLGPVASNIGLSDDWPTLDASGPAGLTASLADVGHAFVDLGDDTLTRGRAHPMIDPALRLALVQEAAADPRVGVLLLDVVLGHAAHPDPAADHAPAIRAARQHAASAGREMHVVVSLTGTRGDPQGLEETARALVDAGAVVHLSNAEAARSAVALVNGNSVCASAGLTAAAAEPGRPGHHPVDGSTAAAGASALLAGPRSVVTAGVDLLADSLAAQAVETHRVLWRPPPAGLEADVLAVLTDPRRETANADAVARVLGTRAALVDVRPAGDALGLRRGTFLHAGPPLVWERASGPMRGALIGALLFEGLADDPAEAEAHLERGRLADGTPVTLQPCHHHRAVGPMAGVVSPSMWVFEIQDPDSGRAAFCSLNEGLGKVLRYGAYGDAVTRRLRWMSHVLGPLLQQAVRRRAASTAGPVDVRAITAQMLQMGDEGHNRNRAGTMMLVRELVPELLELGAPAQDVADVVRFCNGNDHFFLNLVMPACKLALDAGRDVPGSSLVVAMARNGTDFGIQVSGTGDRWFTGPAQVPDGLFLGDFGPQDANPDIGDSTITETAGIGGFSMAAAPAIVAFVGGDAGTALSTTQRMYEITLAEHPVLQIPALGFRGAPMGIDVLSVVRTGVLPQINTGMAGRVAGTGQVGAGLVNPPMECFTDALRALAAARP